jgi:ABC-2 type transport system ATP-binding protein
MSLLEVSGLRKTYGGRAVVDGVDLHVEAGEIFGILGPNGAGKTTTVECIVGLRTPDAGRIRIAGFDPGRDRRQVVERVGVQLQACRLPDKLTVAEAVELQGSFYADPVDGDLLLDRLGLGPSRERRYAALSGGQQQRLAVALALVGRPQVAVLDELTTGLDPQARREAWDLIEDVRDQGTTVLLVTHFMEEAERLCDRVALIDRGRVTASGSPVELVRGAGARVRLEVRVRPGSIPHRSGSCPRSTSSAWTTRS